MLFLGLQEQVRVGIDTYLLPLFSITKHWALDVAIGIGYLCTFYKLVTYMDMNKRVAVKHENISLYKH